MNAYEIPNLRFSMPAGGVVARHRFVSVSEGAGVQATASTAVIGVSMNQTKAGEVLEIADGIVIVEAGGAVTAGALVASNADGKAVAGESGNAIAITAAGAAGDFIAVKL